MASWIYLRTNFYQELSIATHVTEIINNHFHFRQSIQFWLIIKVKKVHNKFKALSTHKISGEIVLINWIFNKSHGSTNINEVIRAALNFFIQKFHEHK